MLISNFFGEDCVEWFINEMLEIESYMETYFKIELENNLVTIPKNYDQLLVGYVKKNLNLKM